MSFEGHYQFLCSNGHTDEIDWMDFAYAEPPAPSQPEGWRCEDCGAGPIWYNLVNDTNGCLKPNECPDPGACDCVGYVELTLQPGPPLEATYDYPVGKPGHHLRPDGSWDHRRNAAGR